MTRITTIVYNDSYLDSFITGLILTKKYSDSFKNLRILHTDNLDNIRVNKETDKYVFIGFSPNERMIHEIQKTAKTILVYINHKTPCKTPRGKAIVNSIDIPMFDKFLSYNDSEELFGLPITKLLDYVRADFYNINRLENLALVIKVLNAYRRVPLLWYTQVFKYTLEQLVDTGMYLEKYNKDEKWNYLD